MRNFIARLVIGTAITAMGMYGADSMVGTWKLNLAKSTSTMTNPLKSQTDVREATPDGGLKVTRTGELADATPLSYSFAFKQDGREYPVTGAQFDTVASKRIDANTTSTEAKNSGTKFDLTSRFVISKDGKTLTQTSRGTDSKGKPISMKYVFERQ
jgi:hypothetical protein